MAQHGPDNHYERYARLDQRERELERRILHPAVKEATIDPSKSFLDYKSRYDESALLALLRRMPKGAVLHTHGIAAVDFHALVDLARADPNCFVFDEVASDNFSPIRGEFGFFADPGLAGKGWRQASSQSAGDLYDYLTLPSGLETVSECWDEFGVLWRRVAGLARCAPLMFGRGGVLWKIMEGHLQDNTIYVEIKLPVYVPFRNVFLSPFNRLQR